MARYAAYLIPPLTTDLWKRGCSWLGWDPENSAEVDRPQINGLSRKQIVDLTARASQYGFHGTLVAPFYLEADKDEQDLISALRTFCKARQSFRLNLELAELGEFLAFRPSQPNGDLFELHCDLLSALAPYQRELSPDDLLRRSKNNSLSERQQQYLNNWGYPYVLEEFRFHMTLTERISDPDERSEILSELKIFFSRSVEQAITVNGVAVFFQPDRSSNFIIKEYIQFTD